MGFCRHSRKRLSATKAEGVRVFPYLFFDGIESWNEVFENSFFKNVSVRPGAPSPIIGRFRLTTSDGFQDEIHFILDAVFAAKSVD